MTTHLTIISYKRHLEMFFEKIYLEADPGPRRLFARCQNVAELQERVVNAGFDVSLLDLVGHGSPTHFQLGDEVLLESGTEPPEALKLLNFVLPKRSKLRILGCETGVEDSGLAMLKSVSQALEGREVFGTTVELFPNDFDAHGLRSEIAQRWLISSRLKEPVKADNRMQPNTEDKQSARNWEALLPGYGVVGRGTPMASAELKLRHQGMTVAVLCDRRLILIGDSTMRPPLMLRWTNPGQAPSISELAQRFEAEPPGNTTAVRLKPGRPKRRGLVEGSKRIA